MKHRNPLLQWAAQYRYPQLVLSKDDKIRAGEDSWRRFVASRNQKRILLAWQRITKWNELANKQSA